MDYKITAADASIGQIQVTYSQDGADVATYAIDVPIVAGAFITGAALDTEIRSRAPVWFSQRKQEVAAATGFSSIEVSAAVQATAVPDIYQLKDAKCEAINTYRDKVLASGVVFNGNQFDSDPTSVSNLTALVASLSAGVTLPAGFVWRSSANTDIPMSAADLVGLLGTMIQTANMIYQTSWSKKATVMAATTADQVDAVEWVVPGALIGAVFSAANSGQNLFAAERAV